MAIFRNDIEREAYYKIYCFSCKNEKSCPVLASHVAYEFDKDKPAFLNAAIPFFAGENKECIFYNTIL